jgi:hypothetical protein
MTQKHKPARKRLSVECLEDRLCPSTLALDSPLTKPDAAVQARVSQSYGELPLSFEANQGQTDAKVNFLSRGSGYTLFLSPTEATLALRQVSDGGDLLTMQVIGANPNARAMGRDPLPGVSNYLIGSDPSQWHTAIANYGRVEYANAYSGIDVIYYGNQRQLEYDFVVAPGADPQAIQLRFQGAQSKTLDSQGNLVLHTSGGDVIERAPVLYQESKGAQQAVAGRYALESNGQVGFEIGAYDPSRPLVIDPVLVYSTYLGGKSGTTGYAIAVDAAGNAYVAGTTQSRDFPVLGAGQPRLNGVADVFITKLNASGTSLIYSTYLGGKGGETPFDIAVDAGGNAYVAGVTTSTNFPTQNAWQSKLAGGFRDFFLTRLNASGSALVYSTYLGGTGDEQPSCGLAVDGSGNAYLAGYTDSTDFPLVNAFQTAKAGSWNAVVAKVNTNVVGAASLVFSTYLGGSSYDGATDVAVDASGNAYVTGFTTSADFPVKNPYQGTYGGSTDAFVAKLTANGALTYSTYLGGSGNDHGYGIAVDGPGNAYVVGSTVQVSGGAAFPVTPGAFQTSGPANTFVTKLNPTGSALVYSTLLGTTIDSGPRLRIAVDSSGSAAIVATVGPSGFPTTADSLPYGGAESDAAVAKLSADGTALVGSTYLGGSGSDHGYGIAVDGGGSIYVTGETVSTNFPTANGYQPQYKGSTDAFVTKLTFGSPLVAASLGIGSASNALTSKVIAPILRETFTRWQGAGVATSARYGIDVRIADLATHVGRRLKATSVHIEMMDAVFTRGEWLQDVLLRDHAFVASA